MALWLKEGPDSDVVISTRARLARNMKGVAFPAIIKGTPKAKEVMRPAIETFVENADFRFIGMKDIEPIERARLTEDHIISKDLAMREDGAVIVSPDESLSIMLMEEDAYRLQCMLPGLQTDKALSLVSELDKMLGKNVEYAYDDELGFLTGCITNVGTGLRMSAMLHLPALTMTHAINRLIQQVGQLGLTVRGIYGEGSEASGNIYQISNQLTLGLSEAEIIQNVRAVVENLVEQERHLRHELMTEKHLDMCDAICRALAILQSARKMDTKEALRLLSSVNIGISEKVISGMTSAEIYNTMLAILPANLSRKGMTAEQRDERRAQLLRKMTAKAVIVEE
ncbi:MAG: protein arginine kinase [Christensenellaceae bacterium]|nr:protein arginine kinase [Christensenellaceae bacterium]